MLAQWQFKEITPFFTPNPNIEDRKKCICYWHHLATPIILGTPASPKGSVTELLRWLANQIKWHCKFLAALKSKMKDNNT
jgi:hypothetical protein